MLRISTTARRVGVPAVLVALAAFGGAGVASAAPSGCTISVYSYFSKAECTGGSGQYRATVRCDVNNWPDYNRYGRWEKSGPSYAYCDINHRAFNAGYQTR
ncbi:hypothetical protein [Pseudonocardia lacus]|uniref:hypothetical protein n=1 Tax=Pseudonocardia lacus TaxID=2835865 RepID=UPI001BDC22F8|nr:hypothetical protein [Pseudonocardia lacus]